MTWFDELEEEFDLAGKEEIARFNERYQRTREHHQRRLSSLDRDMRLNPFKQFALDRAAKKDLNALVDDFLHRVSRRRSALNEDSDEGHSADDPHSPPARKRRLSEHSEFEVVKTAKRPRTDYERDGRSAWNEDSDEGPCDSGNPRPGTDFNPADDPHHRGPRNPDRDYRSWLVDPPGTDSSPVRRKRLSEYSDFEFPDMAKRPPTGYVRKSHVAILPARKNVRTEMCSFKIERLEAQVPGIGPHKCYAFVGDGGVRILYGEILPEHIPPDCQNEVYFHSYCMLKEPSEPSAENDLKRLDIAAEDRNLSASTTHLTTNRIIRFVVCPSYENPDEFGQKSMECFWNVKGSRSTYDRNEWKDLGSSDRLTEDIYNLLEFWQLSMGKSTDELLSMFEDISDSSPMRETPALKPSNTWLTGFSMGGQAVLYYGIFGSRRGLVRGILTSAGCVSPYWVESLVNTAVKNGVTIQFAHDARDKVGLCAPLYDLFLRIYFEGGDTGFSFQHSAGKPNRHSLSQVFATDGLLDKLLQSRQPVNEYDERLDGQFQEFKLVVPASPVSYQR